jgi:hypothetical protein
MAKGSAAAGLSDGMGFSNRISLGYLSILALTVLTAFFVSSLMYGTGCPEITSLTGTNRPSVKYGETTYAFTRFHCYNPDRWLNARTESAIGTAGGTVTDAQDVFLGILILPPGWTMFLAIIYSLYFGMVWLYGLLGAFQGSNELTALFVQKADRYLLVNFFVFVLNLFCWIFMRIREGQNDYASNTNWACATFAGATIRWDLCGYVSAQVFFFLAFTILSFAALQTGKKFLVENGGYHEQ